MVKYYINTIQVMYNFKCQKTLKENDTKSYLLHQAYFEQYLANSSLVIHRSDDFWYFHISARVHIPGLKHFPSPPPFSTPCPYAPSSFLHAPFFFSFLSVLVFVTFLNAIVCTVIWPKTYLTKTTSEMDDQSAGVQKLYDESNYKNLLTSTLVNHLPQNCCKAYMMGALKEQVREFQKEYEAMV